VTDFQLYQLPGIVLTAGALLLGVATWKKDPAVAFGVWFMALSLLPASNLFFPAAGLLSERTLFTPSAGAMIALGALVPWGYRVITKPVARAVAAVAVLGLIGVGVWRSSAHTRVWKNNATLFEQAVIDAPNVYRSHVMLGAVRFNEGRIGDGEKEFSRAIALYDRDPSVYYVLGDQYRTAGLYRQAADMFRRTLDVDSTLYEARARLALSYAELGQWSDADREAKRTLAHDTRHAKAMLDILRLASAARRYPVTLRDHPLPPAETKR
jgi:tetratricopeptide (TPR) repeat protein